MPSNTYTLIEKITVGAAGASSITFTSIPQTYTDLKVVISVRDATNNNGVVKITFNGSATGYTARELVGSGAAASSDTNYTGSGTYYGTEGSSAPSNATASTFSNCEFYIPNYTSSNNKSISADSLYENNGTTAYQSLSAGLWSNSAAITSITVTQFSGNNFAQYSTFYLYGIAKEGVSPSPSSAPYATGGDEIKLIGSYWYHIFTTTGTFTPKKNLSCDVLSLGGGGSGGASTGGGGGAGELDLYTTINTTANTNYTATIGAGGAGQGNFAIRNNGNTTTFSTITSLGGGGGGNEQNLVNGGNGGSGGGGGWNGTGGTASGSNTFAGGNGYNASGQSTGGGGGGATAVGTNGTNTNAGNGGQGYTLSTADSNLTSGNFSTFQGMTVIASGGGAGASSTRTAGTGGTGAGSGTNSTTAGSAATSYGSGGGGGGWVGGVGTGAGGNGAGGLVVIRYAA
jgi:hypothetical protein